MRFFQTKTQHHRNREDRGPLRVMFVLTSMPVGGAETLLVNLIQRMNRDQFAPEVCCLKERGPLGEQLAESIPVHANFIRGKLDFLVLGKLKRLIKSRRIDAIVTVGCGDKMFWGRLAARLANVPVIASALHSTGWPDGVGRINRQLTPITDAFIGCARAHGQHLVDGEGFPQAKVFVIPNGVDVDRFSPIADGDQDSEATRTAKNELRIELGLPTDCPLATIVAALRPEKNHRRFLSAAASTLSVHPAAQFAIVGDGEMRSELENYAEELGIQKAVHFLGSRSDIPDILRASDVFLLTSDNEAAPVSIMEAMASGLPVIASDVGSVHEMVIEGETGFLVPTEADAFADRLSRLLSKRDVATAISRNARAHAVNNASVQVMVDGYEQLINAIYDKKSESVLPVSPAPQPVLKQTRD